MSAPTACYTTARVARGALWHLERHAARLVRDAALLGLGALDPRACRGALLEEAGRAFPGRDGVVRLEARAVSGAAPRLRATTRELGPEPASWRAVLARSLHPGPSPWSCAKTSERGPYEHALDEAARAGADEALLADAAGQLVEGARTNLIVVLASGALVTPPLARGAQAGIGRALLLECAPSLAEGDVPIAALRDAREVIAVNAVRGPIPIVTLDGRAVGAGRPGDWAGRLARLFWEAPEQASSLPP